MSFYICGNADDAAVVRHELEDGCGAIGESLDIINDRRGDIEGVVFCYFLTTEKNFWELKGCYLESFLVDGIP